MFAREFEISFDMPGSVNDANDDMIDVIDDETLFDNA